MRKKEYKLWYEMKLSDLVKEKLLIHSRSQEEVCGFLLANSELIIDAVAVENSTLGDPRTTYLIDPLQMLEVDNYAENYGLNVVGHYHSHPPPYPAVPSETDHKTAVSNWVYVIISGSEIRMWELKNGNFKDITQN